MSTIFYYKCAHRTCGKVFYTQTDGVAHGKEEHSSFHIPVLTLLFLSATAKRQLEEKEEIEPARKINGSIPPRSLSLKDIAPIREVPDEEVQLLTEFVLDDASDEESFHIPEPKKRMAPKVKIDTKVISKIQSCVFCKVFDKGDYTLKDLYDHILKDHVGVFYCTLCVSYINTSALLPHLEHLQNVHWQAIKIENFVITHIQCKWCHRDYHNPTTFSKHIKLKHPGTYFCNAESCKKQFTHHSIREHALHIGQTEMEGAPSLPRILQYEDFVPPSAAAAAAAPPPAEDLSEFLGLLE